MSDYLESVRQALAEAGCWMAEDWGDQHNSAVCDACIVDDAARRLVRLTETGPDYEAAKITLYEILREAGVSVVVNSDLVVDAAVPWLSDYTEEETE